MADVSLSLGSPGMKNFSGVLPKGQKAISKLPFASVSKRVLVQSQISFIGTQILVHLHVNKTNFHMKGFALGLALKQTRKGTRKSPVRPVSQSCAVDKSEKFWRVTGQSNLADRMEDCCTGQSEVV